MRRSAGRGWRDVRVAQTHVALAAAVHVRAPQDLVAEEDFAFTLGDTPGALAATLLIACVAGLVGGLLGLGGGMLIGPLLLELGAHPQVRWAGVTPPKRRGLGVGLGSAVVGRREACQGWATAAGAGRAPQRE